MKKTILAMLLATLVGCSSSNTMTPENAEDKLGLVALQSAENCCETLESLVYQPIVRPETIHVDITAQSPKVELRSGKTFVAGLALPEAAGSINLTVYSVVGKTAFVPTVLVLDGQHKVLDVIDRNVIEYSESSLLYKAGFIGDYVLPQKYSNGESPKYLVVITTSDDLAEYSMPMPPSEFALRSGQISAENPFYSTNKIPHSAIGRVTFEFDYDPTGVLSETTQEKSERKQSISEYVDVDQKSVMSSEQEQAFNLRIQKAVAEGDFERALSVANEAERLGSPTAKETFIKSMKNYQ
ncbi:MalM family protein [Vibrio mediterranei]|uniref:MalM family protein n=1 Tax=Vibrio mediterranei TaxID=689 RepID=UPI00406829EC